MEVDMVRVASSARTFSRTNHPGGVRAQRRRSDRGDQRHAAAAAAVTGAAIVVRLATLGADGPSGGFFSEDGPMPW
jgi:hypothetical protein